MNKKKIFRYIGSITGIGLFFFALFVIHRQLKHYHFQDIIAEMKLIPTLSLATAIAMTAFDYFVLTFYDTLAIRYLRQRLKYRKIAAASFVGYAFTHNLNIIGGSAARYRIYSALGLSASDIAKLVVFCGITFWLGFLSVAGVSLVFFNEEIPAALHIPLSLIKPLGFVFLAVSATYIIYIFAGKNLLKFRGWEFEKPSISILLGQITISCSDWIIACGVLYLLMPEGRPGFLQFISFYLLAQIAGVFSNVPGGLGVFETAMLLLLSPFVESSAAFGSLLIYRMVYYLIPFGLAAAALAIQEVLSGRKIIKAASDVFEKWSSIVTPGVLALASFIAGAILLLSGSLPAVKGRMEFLRNILPLEAIELSHFMASVAGAMLLLLGRSLQRRINAAYHLTVILLAASIAFSLLKGFDYEEAIILSVILLLFLPCRKEFYRKAAIFTRRFEAYWFVLIVIVIACSIWVGFFSYRHIEYSNELWWKFAFHSNAPRFLRASSGVVIVALLYTVMQLLLPTTPKTEKPDDETFQTVIPIIQSSEKTYGNIALLGDKQFLFNKQKNAFFMYAIEGRSWITMGDPVGPEEEWHELIWKFKELSDYYDGWPVFYHIENSRLDYYIDAGMSFLKLGEEAIVDLRDFTLEGPANKNLRNAHNKISKLGYRFEIFSKEQTIENIETLKNISDSWLKEKNTREKRFSIGYFDKKYMSYFPSAVIRRNAGIHAFANIWTTEQKKELSIDLMRHLPDCPNGIMDFLFAELLIWGKQAGYNSFNLGITPLSGLEDSSIAPMWHKIGTFMFKHGEHFYNYQGLRQYKQKFNPNWRPKYLACPRGLMVPRILLNVASLISGGFTGIISR